MGSEPQILFYARRRSATRYIFFYPLTGEFPDARARQQSVIEEVRATRPLYVVWADVATSLSRTPRSEPLIFDATTELLAREYAIELVVRPTRAWQPMRSIEARRLGATSSRLARRSCRGSPSTGARAEAQRSVGSSGHDNTTRDTTAVAIQLSQAA